MAGTKLKPVSLIARGVVVDRPRFASSVLGWRPHHTLIFSSSLLLHNLLDDFFQLTRLEPPVTPGVFHTRKNCSHKGTITPNRIFHRHSKPPKHESYETRKQAGISTQRTEHHNDSDYQPPRAGTADQIKVIAGKRGLFTMLLNLNSLHDLFQYEEFGQAAYTTAI